MRGDRTNVSEFHINKCNFQTMRLENLDSSVNCFKQYLMHFRKICMVIFWNQCPSPNAVSQLFSVNTLWSDQYSRFYQAHVLQFVHDILRVSQRTRILEVGLCKLSFLHLPVWAECWGPAAPHVRSVGSKNASSYELFKLARLYWFMHEIDEHVLNVRGCYE